MESTGLPGRIQVSSDTADLLKASGKESWLIQREDLVDIKGKGKQATYFLNVSKRGEDGYSSTHDTTSDHSDFSGAFVEDEVVADTDAIFSKSPDRQIQRQSSTLSDTARVVVKDLSSSKKLRLVGWNVETLSNILKKIEASRSSRSFRRKSSIPVAVGEGPGSVLDEVAEVIPMPTYEESIKDVDPTTVHLSETVTSQLRNYISEIAAAYRDNPFHNFEHASHVCMATLKIFTRVVNPKIDGVSVSKSSLIHDYTYGITSDPIIEFACVFSALVHDVDHTGVPNATLVKENTPVAQVYKNKSVAEQNSFNFAWDLLMEPRHKDFLQAICQSKDDLKRFRQICVNMVMATDIVNKELNGFRKQRWEKAFGKKKNAEEESEKAKIDRKATIVLEHLIQAADISHTMQHWRIYRSWNSKLFMETYAAYKAGRTDKNPADDWYEGELGFFDFYIIPLAKKLRDCGVFGVSSDEHLDYAQRNRQEWMEKGRDTVAEYLEEAMSMDASSATPSA